MTKYLDEYNPTGRGLSVHAQADAAKLKFNNIRSCIAVVLAPTAGNTMAGIHLTTTSTRSTAELASAIAELVAAAGPGPHDAYLVATFGYHVGTPLAASLKAVARHVYLCDVSPAPGDPANEADVDVKFEIKAGRMIGYVRQHALILEIKADGSRGRTKRPGWEAAARVPGKPTNETDRDQKVWQPVAFVKLP